MSDFVGVILAAGRGSRMGTLGEIYPKALLPIANEPLIAHHLRLMHALGIREVHVVVGHRALDIVREVGDGRQYGLVVHYVEQGEARGSAHAVGRLLPYIHTPFVLTLGDYYFSASEPERLIQRLREGHSAISAKREPERKLIIESCELRVDSEDRVLSIVEKPRAPLTNLKGCGFYAFQPEFFDAVARTPRTALRDEYEISNSLDLFIQAGHPVYAEEIITWDSNFTRPEDVLEANLQWLEHNFCETLIAEDAQVEAGAHLERSVVGRGCRIEGPAELTEVVVFPGTHLPANGTIERALMTPKLSFPCSKRVGGGQPH